MSERLSNDPLDRVGFTAILKNLVVNALKKGRNGEGVEQHITLPQGEALLFPEDQQPIRNAVDAGDVHGVAVNLRDAIVDNTNVSDWE